jgi:singapore isolate B (sub-type 7) whole genome shotgun sequence assembly, scaffold_1
VERLEEDIRERFLPTLRETEHDRIAAGLALGLALLFYDTHTHGERLLHEMLEDNKPYVRMAGVLGLGLAYVGQHARHSVVAE